MNHYLDALQECRSAGTYRTLVSSRNRGKYIEVNGSSLINLSSNDYLGLSDLPELWEDFLTCAANYAPSSGSSRLLSGNDEAYTLFEDDLAQVYHKESALLWDSGYHANSGIIPVLALPGTVFLIDRLVHASIVDGIRLSGAQFQRFRHNDMSHLTQLIEANHSSCRRIWIVTESLFSMDGDFAPLQDLVCLKDKYDRLFLYLDEAHAVGVRGKGGLGYASELGLTDKIDILVGTLGKALGSVGAYSLQKAVFRSLFISKARPMIFSTALPPVVIRWSHYIFNKQLNMDERRRYLRGLIDQFALLMDRPCASQIIPWVIPGEAAVTQAADDLMRAGFFVRPIRKPTVPEGMERLRFSLTAALTIQDIERLTRCIPI